MSFCGEKRWLPSKEIDVWNISFVCHLEFSFAKNKTCVHIMKQKGSLWVFAICSQWQTMCKPSFFHVSIAEFNTSYHWRRGKKRKLLFTCYILTSSGTVCMQIIITHLPSTSSGNELFWSLQNQINLCMLQTFFSGKHKTLRPQMLTIEKKQIQ